MTNCATCGKPRVAKIIGYCIDCLRRLKDKSKLENIHIEPRLRFQLPIRPPRNRNGITCRYCANRCQMTPGFLSKGPAYNTKRTSASML